MPISKEFLPLFTSFVTNYMLNGTPRYYTWAKEQNHKIISQIFDDLLTIITNNQDSFHDTSIIEHLNNIVLLSAKTNGYLLECWIDFLTKYNEKTHIYSSISSMNANSTFHINVGPDGTPSEKMLRDAMLALDATQKSFKLAQQAHMTELDLLKRQIEELQTQNSFLTIENRQLKDQVSNEQRFQSLHPQINTAQEQLTAFAALLKTLSEVTSAKPTSVVKPELTPTMDEEPTKAIQTKITVTKDNPLELTGTKTIPNPPKPKIPPTPPNMTITAPNPKFFPGKSFLSDLTEELEKRKKKGTTSNESTVLTDSPESTIEKKK